MTRKKQLQEEPNDKEEAKTIMGNWEQKTVKGKLCS